MTMLHTYQGSYEPMRLADVCADETLLDGETASYTYHWHDKPSGAKELGTECNGCVIVMHGTDVDNNDTFVFNLYGYAEGGPAEFIAEVSGTIGVARINDVTTTLYADAMNIVEQGHIRNLAVKDGAESGRIAKLTFDTGGLKYLWLEFSDISDAYRPYIRVY